MFLVCPELAYPPPDTSVRDVLVQPHNETDQRIYYHIFFMCLFAAGKREVDMMIEQAPEMSYDDLSHQWRTSLRANRPGGMTRSRRGDFYQGVVRSMKVRSPTDIS